MPSETVGVFTASDGARSIRLAYLCRSDKQSSNSFIQPYFQGIRNGMLLNIGRGHPENTEIATSYRNMERRYADQLASELPEQAFDAILSPPSRYNHAAAYRDSARMLAARDITSRFRKEGSTLSGAGGKLEKILSELSYDAHGDEGCLHSVLIVDDTFCTGRTVAAVITRLLEAGVPPDCSFTVAVPLWAVPK